MGEIRRVSLARGKRVLKVAPVAAVRDPETVASVTLISGANVRFAAMLTEDERRALIQALGGEIQ